MAGRKKAIIVAKDLELGWSGSEGGRTVTFRFFDGKGTIGELEVSAARLRWRKAGRKKGAVGVPVDKINVMFEDWDSR